MEYNYLYCKYKTGLLGYLKKRKGGDRNDCTNSITAMYF